MADDIGGVWRTIGGRRVFIKTGQSLSSAMKASGKFKKRKKLEEEYGDPREAVAYYLKKGEFDKAEEYLKDYGLEDEREEFAEGLNYEAQKDYKNYLNKTQEFQKATKKVEEQNLKKALEENARMNHQITRLTSDLNTTDDPKEKEFIKATMKRYENQVKENRKTAMKIVQQMADREEVLPSEIQDRYNIRDSQLGIKADTSFAEAIERQIQEQRRYEIAEEAKKVRNTDSQISKKIQKEYENNFEEMKTLKSQGGKESALDKSMKALDRIENLARENKDLPGWSEESLIKKGKQMGAKDFEKWIANEKQNTGTTGAKTNGLQEGIPYKVKMGKGIEKQSIYLGKDENGRHVFYDGEGVTGKYAFSEDFIKKNNIQFDKDNNDPVKVNKLTQELKKSGAKEYDVDMSDTTTKEYNKKSAEVGYPRSDEKGNYRIEKNGEYQYKMYESLKDLEPKSEKAKSTNDTMNIAIRYNQTIQTLMKKGMSRQEALEYIKKNLMK